MPRQAHHCYHHHQQQQLQPSHSGSGSCKEQRDSPLLVLKVGTSSIIESGEGLTAFSLSNLGRLVDTVCHVRAKGYQVILVTSGAVGAGCMHMRLSSRPSTVEGKQAASAVGQCRMMRLYDDLFAMREMKIGQLILTRTDLLDRTRFVNFKNTLQELLKWSVIPIINENDSLATAQFRFGDNDTLAAYIAVSLEADWLFLLTDVDCLYTANPRSDPSAKPISYVGLVDQVFQLLKSDEGNNAGTQWGSGGMHTKIVAAKLASATGIPTALCNGEHPQRVLDIVKYVHNTENRAENSPEAEGYITADTLGEMPYLGTIFAAKERTQKLHDRRRWVLSLPVHGRLYVDSGAAKAIVTGRKSLFAVGIRRVAGHFVAGEAVSVCLDPVDDLSPNRDKDEDDSDTTEFARCLVRYGSVDIRKIIGKHSDQFKGILGIECSDEEVAHRNTIVFVNPCVVYGCQGGSSGCTTPGSTTAS